MCCNWLHAVFAKFFLPTFPPPQNSPKPPPGLWCKTLPLQTASAPDVPGTAAATSLPGSSSCGARGARCWSRPGPRRRPPGGHWRQTRWHPKRPGKAGWHCKSETQRWLQILGIFWKESPKINWEKALAQIMVSMNFRTVPTQVCIYFDLTGMI